MSYPSSINVAELLSIQSLIVSIYDYHQQNPWLPGACFSIYTDSQTSYNSLRDDYYPEFYHIWRILQDIFDYINKLAMDGISFDMYKVKAHVRNSKSLHHQRNQIVDQLARAANQSYDAPLDINNSYYEYYFNNNNNYVNAYWNHKYDMEYKQSVPRVASHNLLFELPDTKEFLNEMRLLTYPESSRLNMYRMGYMTSTYDWSNFGSPVCFCSIIQPLSLEHIIYHCPKYKKARIEWLKQIQQIEPLYLQQTYYSDLKFILFPHLLYKKIDLRDFDNLTKRYKLLLFLLSFVEFKVDNS